MSQMRTRNSVKNTFVSVFMYVLVMLFGFISQNFFLTYLGDTYNGLNGLFKSIISVMSVAELGFAQAIVYNMYQPIASRDFKTLSSLLSFYKKVYRIVALVVAVVGLCIMPFIPRMAQGGDVPESLYLLFGLYLIDTVSSYLLSYKRSIFYADQKQYYINIIHIGYVLLLNGLQIALMILTRNFVIYLLLRIICQILENVIISLYADKKYPELKQYRKEKLPGAVKTDILRKVKGLCFHQIGFSVVKGTDYMIISTAKSLGVLVTGMYYNYNIIIDAINSLFTNVFNSITSSIGNLLLEGKKDRSYRIFKNMLFINAAIYTTVAAGVLCCIEPVIQLWIGDGYLLDRWVLVIIVINMFLNGMRYTSNSFKSAGGVFYEDRHVPIIESVVNLVLSLVFLYFFGLAGVLLGTICSNLVIFLYGHPKYVYGKLFDQPYFRFLLDYGVYFLLAAVVCAVSLFLSGLIIIENTLLAFFVKGVVAVAVSIVGFVVCFFRTEEFSYSLNLVKNLIRRRA